MRHYVAQFFDAALCVLAKLQFDNSRSLQLEMRRGVLSVWVPWVSLRSIGSNSANTDRILIRLPYGPEPEEENT